MVEEENQEAETEDYGFDIDPANWEELKETFPGKVVESVYQAPNEKYRAATSFRPEIPEELPNGTKIIQWSCIVERLDARFINPEGEEFPVRRFVTVDSHKWNAKKKLWTPMSRAFKKETYITATWKRAFGQIQPPSVLIGKIALFDLYRDKDFGGQFTARNVLVPVQVLAPDYAYDGDVQLIQTRGEGERAGEGEQSAPSSTNNLLSDEEAIEALIPILIGKEKASVATILSSLPSEIRTSTVMTGVATGSLIDTLEAEGKIKVDDSGVIAVA